MGLTIEQTEALVNAGWETFSDQTLVGIESLADALLRAEAAETMMSYTHPPGCVVSASHAPDVITTCHCGWCASIVRAEAAEKRLKEAKGLLVEMWREMDLVLPNEDITTKVEAYLIQEGE